MKTGLIQRGPQGVGEGGQEACAAGSWRACQVGEEQLGEGAVGSV